MTEELLEEEHLFKLDLVDNLAFKLFLASDNIQLSKWELDPNW